MHWCEVASLLLTTAAIFDKALAQVVTITQRPSSCKAIYTSGSRSVTVVRSTVTVSPEPWTDEDTNSGKPFVLQVFGDSLGAKRQANQPVWVMRNGDVTANGAEAAQYMIEDGKLTAVGGGYVSTNGNVPRAPFAVMSPAQRIQKTFSTQGGSLRWTNAAFLDGAAQLCRVAGGSRNRGRVVANFNAPPDYYCRNVRVSARPPSEATGGGPGGYTSAGSVSTVTSIRSMSSSTVGPPPYSPPRQSTSEPSSMPGGQTSRSPSGGASSGSGMPTTGSSSRGSTRGMSSGPGGYSNTSSRIVSGQSIESSIRGASASASPSEYVSPNGICGSSTGYTCAGSAFGNCCSRYGYCGSDDAFCGVECQPAWGSCSPVEYTSGAQSPPAYSSTSNMSPRMSSTMRSSPMMTLSPSMTSMRSSMTPPNTVSSSIVMPTPGFECPGDDGEVVIDINGVQYTLGCGRDTTPAAYDNVGVPNSSDECFALCDDRPGCQGFTYSGAMNGFGPGTCFFKRGDVAFEGRGQNLVAAIRYSPPNGYSSEMSSPMSTYTSTAGPIGPINPGGPSSSMSQSSSMLMSSSGPGMSSSMSMGMASSLSSSGAAPYTGASTSSSSSTMPASTGYVSPDGHCGTQGNGGSPEGYTCTGSIFGTCCSDSGFCGSTIEYCLAGCQPGYGDCTPQTGNPITANGRCGPDRRNQTCTGGVFGPCCSTSGNCGSTSEYCAPGNCDPMFGMCDDGSSSSMSMSTSSMRSSMSSSMTSSSSSMASSSSMMGMSSSSSSPSMPHTTTTTTSSIASSSSASTPPSPNPDICPGADATTYTDTQGNQYVVSCGRDFSPGAFASAQSPDFVACINACSERTDQPCVGVGYSGGMCYFKADYFNYITNPQVNAAVLQSRIGGPAPPPYVPPTTTTTTTPRSSTSSSTRSSSSTTTSTAVTSSSSSSRSSSSTRSASTTTSGASTSTGAYLTLASPTPCDFGDPAGFDEDDSFCQIDLPFTMRMYSQTGASTFASTNGFISLLEGSSQYAALELPAENVPNNTVAPFFDDLYLFGDGDPAEGIFYQVNQAQTAVTYEYYLARSGQRQTYHFTVTYDSAVPGVFVYTYYETGGSDDNGQYAAVGSQGVDGSGDTIGFTYSYQVQSITPGLVVTCDTNANTCVTTVPGGG